MYILSQHLLQEIYTYVSQQQEIGSSGRSLSLGAGRERIPWRKAPDPTASCQALLRLLMHLQEVSHSTCTAVVRSQYCLLPPITCKHLLLQTQDSSERKQLPFLPLLWIQELTHQQGVFFPPFFSFQCRYEK